MEEYQKRLVEEFEELSKRTNKLEEFLRKQESEKKDESVTPEMLELLKDQFKAMSMYRKTLVARLDSMGLLDEVSEYPELEVGDIFSTGEDETFICVGHEPDGCPICEPWGDVAIDKSLRKSLDEIVQELRETTSSRERSIAITKLQEAIMWLGMDLKRLGTPNPYPESKNPESPVVHPTADGLKM